MQYLIITLLFIIGGPYIEYNKEVDISNTIPYKKIYKSVTLPDFTDIFNIYEPILTELGASIEERNILITLATIENAGLTDYYKACELWGCDKGKSHSLWQIQCVDHPNPTQYRHGYWLSYLKKHGKIYRCSELDNDPRTGALAALLILRKFSTLFPNDKPIQRMLRWGVGTNKLKRILMLYDVHNNIMAHRENQKIFILNLLTSLI